MHGFTDYIFRNIHNEVYSNINCYYTPFIRTGTGVNIKKKIKDILPENNKNLKIIPQILSNNSEQFISLSQSLYDMGYYEINLNMGCPFPMVVKKGSGAGLLKDLEKTKIFLNEITEKIPNKLSIKIRTGFSTNNEIIDIVNLLNLFEFESIIIHPRTAKQMYKGKADLTAFKYAYKNLKHKVIYNGDILSLENFINFKNSFPEIKQIMIGRGLLIDPALHLKINGKQKNYQGLFIKFHNKLLEEYQDKIIHKHYVLDRMKAFWNYWILNFNDKKLHKKIKKCKNINNYIKILEEI
jgi:tRNA-dihydrouridine synthase